MMFTRLCQLQHVQFNSVALPLRALTAGRLSVTGQPVGPPPSYPPPPVPAAPHHHQNSSPGSIKAPAALTPPLHRNPTSPLPRKPQPAVAPPPGLKDRPRGLPPPVPHPQNPLLSTPPPPPPPNAKPVKGRFPSTEEHGVTERKSPPAALIQASTLPICDNLETRMSLNGPSFRPFNAGGSRSLDSYHKGVMETRSVRPIPPPSRSTVPEISSHGHLPPNSLPQGPPSIKTAPYNKPEIPKPPTPSAKPQLAPTKFKQPGVQPQ